MLVGRCPDYVNFCGSAVFFLRQNALCFRAVALKIQPQLKAPATGGSIAHIFYTTHKLTTLHG